MPSSDEEEWEDEDAEDEDAEDEDGDDEGEEEEGDEDAEGEDGDEDAEDEEEEALVIDIDGFERRAVLLPIGKGGFYNLAVNGDGKLLY